ncbi:hypothetical protein SAMN05421803_11761 [Nocardiopsis flavescens]|uniref:Ead/Ea22-like family protein n=1 Tax=Nocardiopsis flavescens TaxID=758803 RepID=A0A1M6RDN3_9ACTN|nr:hypothetical protein [Nocardiopsis flavescens]SHK30500.1 hypothetical protein SAMN05421803_11761 [Nocardiopsis flavescens]
MTDLHAIRARVESTARGPWKRGFEADGTSVIHRPHPVVEGAAEVLFGAHGASEADAEFVAHARQDIPALLAEIDRLRGELARAHPGAPRRSVVNTITGGSTGTVIQTGGDYYGDLHL